MYPQHRQVIHMGWITQTIIRIPTKENKPTTKIHHPGTSIIHHYLMHILITAPHLPSMPIPNSYQFHPPSRTTYSISCRTRIPPTNLQAPGWAEAIRNSSRPYWTRSGAVMNSSWRRSSTSFARVPRPKTPCPASVRFWGSGDLDNHDPPSPSSDDALSHPPFSRTTLELLSIRKIYPVHRKSQYMNPKRNVAVVKKP